MAREQAFTASVEAHNAVEAEDVAENFCEAMGSERWDALSEHVHKTFEAEPAGGGRRRS
jgi:L-asparaginase/Glu-tRNA(Gln) amidotransferase subunit D